MSAAALEVADLAVRFGGAAGARPAVDGVAFSLARGECVALVGETGCGKSATARAIMGLYPPGRATVTGSIRVGGTELSGLAEKARRRHRGAGVALISQDPMTALDPLMRVGRQLERVIRRHRPDARDGARAEAARLLDETGFADPEGALDAWPHQLSGGMRQRVVIAMAMACRPIALLADEPTTALDVTTQAQILDQLDRLRERHGTAVLLITHDLGVVAAYSRRALVMYGGRLVEAGPTATLFETPRHPYTRALLDAQPRLVHGEPRPVRPVPGRLPGLAEALPACAFAPRCAGATAVCRERRPPLQRHGDSDVACHHPLGEAP